MDLTTNHIAPAVASRAAQVFPGNGEMAQLMRAMDWSQTPLGPVETWPQPLRTAVNISLSSRFPIVLWWGPDLLLLYNDAWRPALGALKHPALGKPGREVWAEIWHIIGLQLASVLVTGEATWSDDQLLPMDRYGYLEETYWTYSYSPLRLETGEVAGVFTSVTETTLRVLAERRMRTARDLAAAVVDARTATEVCERAADSLAAASADVPFALLYLLDGARAHLAGSIGPASAASLAGPMVDLTAADRSTIPIVRSLAAVVRTGQRVRETLLSEGEAIVAGATATSLNALIFPIVEPGQAAPSAILVAGISPQRALDNDYEGFYELLVSHLSAGLASAHAYEEERRRAEALAEIDRAKTTFFSNVSHEFRTPLTLLLGPLQDSLDDAEQPLPPRQRERIEVIGRNGMRLLKLVNTLLDVARIEAGRMQAIYEPTDLATATAELASSFRSLMEKAGLTLLVACPPLNTLREPVYVDRAMWEKIVLNLLSNAFKFTLSGAITVAIQVDSSEGETVELSIRDTGVGIPADALPHIFDRFHRVEGVRARTHEGSGIGLALVQELVQLHGGTVRVASVVGEGTTFYVRIPTGMRHLPSDQVQTRPSLLSTALTASAYVDEAAHWLPGATSPADRQIQFMADGARDRVHPVPAERLARIVLADDNADMRDYLARILNERYTVQTVTNGLQALEAIRADPPDLVLSDVMMPDLDGFGLLRALRADPQIAPIPIILISARAGEEATMEGLEAGADDYLIKPFSAREVLVRVAARLEIARARHDAVARARQLAAVIEAIADPLAVYDTEGHILLNNVAFQEQMDRFIGEGAGASFATWVRQTPPVDKDGTRLTPEMLPQALALRGKVLRGAEAFEMHLIDREGREGIFSITGGPIRDVTGTIIGAVCVDRDVTEQQRQERRTHEVLDALLAMAATITDVPQHEEGESVAVVQVLQLAQRVLRGAYTSISLVDVQTHTIQALAVAGLDPEIEAKWWKAVQGAQMEDFMSPADIARLAAGEQVIFAVAAHSPDPDQDERDIPTNLVVPALMRQQLLILTVAVRDRSTFTPQEQDLAQATAQLAAHVLEREHLLSEQTTARAREEALAEANRRMNEFLGIASHELRTPLTSVMANIQMSERGLRMLVSQEAALQGTKVGRYHQLLAQSDRQLGRLNRLIGDLLDVSRITAGKLEMRPERGDLVAIIHEAVQAQQVAWPHRVIDLTLPKRMPIEVVADPDRIEQVVVNFVANALKYSRADQPVQVYVQRERTQVRVTVQDHGPGLTPEQQALLFERFARVEAIVQQDGSGVGLGLGLYICKTIIDRHGGTIGVESQAGQGSAFFFTLPLAHRHSPLLSDRAQP